MNLLEFRLLAYKRRNWSYTFIRIQNDKWQPTANDIKVVVKEPEEVINVFCNSEPVLKDAFSVAMTIRTHVPFVATVDTDLHTSFVSETIAATAFNTSGLLDTAIQTSNIAGLKACIAADVRPQKLRDLFGSQFRANVLQTDPLFINLHLDNLVAYTGGALTKATIAKLKDYEPWSLADITKRYNSIFYDDISVNGEPIGDTLKNMTHYMLE